MFSKGNSSKQKNDSSGLISMELLLGLGLALALS